MLKYAETDKRVQGSGVSWSVMGAMALLLGVLDVGCKVLGV